jgi:hypothetical protein
MVEETQDDDTVAEAPLGGTRRQAMQRAQVGVFGLAAMILLIGLAQIIQNQTRQAQAGVVPEAAPTVVPSESPSQASDPLADAGVGPDDLPDGPRQPQATPTATAVPDVLVPDLD